MKYKKYFRKTSLKQKGDGDFFLEEIKRKKPKFFLEVGVFHGVTARNVCELLFKIHNKDIEQINSKKRLIDVVRKDFKLLPLLIIRNPLHAYQSLLHNNMRQSTSSFNDYCNRVMLMINTYIDLDCSILKYEDFCLNPDKELDKMCAILKINYLNDYYKRFSKIPMTGNSGRAVESEKIVSLDPRPISDELKKESEKSKSFKEICFRFDYKIN